MTPDELNELMDETIASVDAVVAAASLDGIPWYEAEIPCRWHRCKTQTKGYAGSFTVYRCACGAIRLNGRGPWRDKNSRRP